VERVHDARQVDEIVEMLGTVPSDVEVAAAVSQMEQAHDARPLDEIAEMLGTVPSDVDVGAAVSQVEQAHDARPLDEIAETEPRRSEAVRDTQVEVAPSLAETAANTDTQVEVALSLAESSEMLGTAPSALHQGVGVDTEATGEAPQVEQLDEPLASLQMGQRDSVELDAWCDGWQGDAVSTERPSLIEVGAQFVRTSLLPLPDVGLTRVVANSKLLMQRYPRAAACAAVFGALVLVLFLAGVAKLLLLDARAAWNIAAGVLGHHG
jgi:hypothetical protein